jgi:glucosamine 6-phosphate synthetase-like amidotransferase/phosphosugar isomerase protein
MTTPAPRTGHPYCMYDEMHAQPDAMRAALVADDAQRDHIARELASTHRLSDAVLGPGFLMPTFVGRGRIYLTGCGTAHHAALTGADWFRRISQRALEVHAAQAFEFTRYQTGGPRTHDALLALSHSGVASATVAAARRAKNEEGMYTIALTAVPGSDVSQASDETLITTTADARAATYTISHLTMLTVLADLARRTAEHLREAHDVALELVDDIAAFPDLAAAALAQEAQIQQITCRRSIRSFSRGADQTGPRRRKAH